HWRAEAEGACTPSTARRTTLPPQTPPGATAKRWGSVFAGVDPHPVNRSVIRDWTVDYFDALHPYSAGGSHVTMMMDEGQDRVRASYRENHPRLVRVKAKYDPDNLF
ncbi:MAG TPA: BBE domain-containing protein, partial [Solirubrobacteraceae bacterium]